MDRYPLNFLMGKILFLGAKFSLPFMRVGKEIVNDRDMRSCRSSFG
jgi:hypothetical protein